MSFFTITADCATMSVVTLMLCSHPKETLRKGKKNENMAVQDLC